MPSQRGGEDLVMITVCETRMRRARIVDVCKCVTRVAAPPHLECSGPRILYSVLNCDTLGMVESKLLTPEQCSAERKWVLKHCHNCSLRLESKLQGAFEWTSLAVDAVSVTL
jgi:hypothetical protein